MLKLERGRGCYSSWILRAAWACERRGRSDPDPPPQIPHCDLTESSGGGGIAWAKPPFTSQAPSAWATIPGQPSSPGKAGTSWAVGPGRGHLS